MIVIAKDLIFVNPDIRKDKQLAVSSDQITLEAISYLVLGFGLQWPARRDNFCYYSTNFNLFKLMWQETPPRIENLERKVNFLSAIEPFLV